MFIQRSLARLALAAGSALMLAAAAAPGAGAAAASGPVAAGSAIQSSSSVSAGPASGQHRVGLSPKVAGPLTTTAYTSHNWDGYFATAPNDGTDFTAVAATWKEPSVTCDSNESWAGFWVGLDGWWNDVVEQGGSEAHCVNGVPSYNVWWEMFPYNYIQTGFSITPGDTIQASVKYSSSTTDFTIVVKDVTSGNTLTQVTPCEPGQDGCPRTSAEVISEDIGGGTDTDGLFYLPDYGTAKYSSISVTNTAGHTGTLSDSAWNLGDVTEVSSTGITKQSTSSLNASGNGFSTTWLHE